MANNGIANTSLGAATFRLMEQYQPPERRLFDDPIVQNLVGAPIRAVMRFAAIRGLAIRQSDAITPGLYGLHICRTRFIDEAVQAALSQGIEQVVILGAGLDTRPYRLARMERVKVFEVDLPHVQEDKKRKIRKCLGEWPKHVTYVPIDFDRQSLTVLLPGAGYDPSKRTVFIWEGVTQYLSKEAIQQTLGFIGAAAPGSRLVFTYVPREVIERRSTLPGAGRMMDVMARRDSAWRSGLEPSDVASFLMPFHLELVRDIGSDHHQANYLEPLGRKLTVSQVERITEAVVMPRPNARG